MEGSPVYLIPGGDAEYRDSCGWMSDDPEVQKALDEIAGRRNTENGGSMFVMPDRDVKVTYGTRRKSESFTVGGHSYEIEWNETAVYNGKKTKPEELAIKVVKDGQELPSSDYKAAVKGKTVVSASGNKAPYIRISFKKKADKEAKKSVKKLKLSFLVTERSIASIDLKSKKVMLKDGKVVIKGLSWKNPYGKRIGLKSLNKKGKGDISIGETVKLGDETGVWIYGKNNYKGSALLKVE